MATAANDATALPEATSVATAAAPTTNTTAAPLTLDQALSGMSFDDAMASIEAMPPDQLAATQRPSSPGGVSLGDALAQVMAEPDASQRPPLQGYRDVRDRMVGSMALGAAKAGLELKDFLFGEPTPDQKSGVRNWIEAASKSNRAKSWVNGVAEGVTQFGIGFVGLGKLKYLKEGIAAAENAGAIAGWSAGVARGAAAGAMFMDPHEERLSNLVQSFPALQNPITSYLATKPEDSAAEGRLKNALEGVVMDVALASALVAVSKSIKYFRAGDVDAANAAAGQADELFAKAGHEEYRASKFFDHEQYIQERGAAANVARSEADRIVAQADEMGGVRKDFLQEPGGSAKIPGEGGPDWRAGDVAGSKTVDGGAVINPVDRWHGGADVGLRDGAVTVEHAPGTSVMGTADAAGTVEGRSAAAGARAAGSEATGGGAGSGLGDHEAGGLLTRADAERALGQLAKDNDALIQYGGRDAAIAEGYQFKGADDLSGIIPWQKFNSAEQGVAWMGQLIDDHAALINKARGGDAKGVLSDAAIDRMVQQRAVAWNEDPAALRGELVAAGKDAPQLAAQMETSFLIANKAYQDAYELAVRVGNGNYTGFGSREAALEAVKARMATATGMYANAKALSSNAARALRRMRGEFRFTDEQLANIHTSDPEALLKVIEATNGDPSLLAQAGKLTAWQRVRDFASSLYAANLLWSWKTQVVNFATSATSALLWRPLETGLGSWGLQLKGAFTRDADLIAQARSIRAQSIKEVTYTAGTLQDGLNAAMKAFMDGDSILTPHGQEHTAAFNAVDLNDLWSRLKEMHSVDDLIHNAVTLGVAGKTIATLDLRALGAADELIRTIRYRNIVLAKASVEADQRGLAGPVAKSFVDGKLKAAFDEMGRGIDPSALAEAQTSVFQNAFVKPEESRFGAVASGYANLVARTPSLRFITPFIKTPVNLFRYGIKLTPGLNLLQREYYQAVTGAAGVEAQARAMGQMVLGSLMGATASTLWASGRITGAGPQDYDQKKQWLSQGNRPYSIVWTNDKGERQFFEFNRLDPFGMVLGLTADYFNLTAGGTLREDEQDSMGHALALAYAHLMRDKTYVKGLNDFLGAIADDHKMTSFARRFVPGLLPFSSLLQSVNPDPVVHELRHWYDGVLARTPGWSSTLPPQRDFLGDPIIAPQGFVSSQKNTPLSDALNEVYAVTGRYIEPPAPKSGQTGGVDLRDFTLESGRSAYDRYQELSGHPSEAAPSLKAALTNLVDSLTYQALPHGGAMEAGTKLGTIMEIVKQYREAAYQQLLAESPKVQEAVMLRRRDLAKAVSTGAKSVKAAGDQGRVGVLNDLLKPYGLSLPAINLPSQ